MALTVQSPTIIPYQELLGNYDAVAVGADGRVIIPYQELLGNYDSLMAVAPFM